MILGALDQAALNLVVAECGPPFPVSSTLLSNVNLHFLYSLLPILYGVVFSCMQQLKVYIIMQNRGFHLLLGESQEPQMSEEEPDSSCTNSPVPTPTTLPTATPTATPTTPPTFHCMLYRCRACTRLINACKKLHNYMTFLFPDADWPRLQCCSMANDSSCSKACHYVKKLHIITF